MSITRSFVAGFFCLASSLTNVADAAETNADSSDGGLALEEVIVTANKRAESERDIAGAIAAISGDLLNEIHASSFQDFATYIPGVSSLTLGAGQNTVIVRGISTGGTSQAVATIGVYIDEVPVGSSTAFALGGFSVDYDVFDLERVELLSGPQGTLYGASTLGGLLKYVTRAPDLDQYAAVFSSEASYTQHGGLNFGERAAVNVPIVDGRLAMRADVLFSRADGFVDNPSRGLEDVNSSEMRGGRVALLGQITPDVSLRLGVIAHNNERDGGPLVDRNRTTGEPVRGELDQSALIDEPYEQNLLLYSGVLNWDLHWATLTAASGWQRVEIVSDFDNTPLYGVLLGTGSTVPFGTPLTNVTRKFTQEIRLASPASQTLEWLIGGYFADEETDQHVRIVNAASPDGTLNGAVLFDGRIPTSYQELAAFGNLTLRFNERFDVTLGVRHSEDEQSYDQQSQGLFRLTGSAEDASGNATTYLVNPRWRVNDGLMLYARAASSYRPGGPNFRRLVNGQPVGNPTFDPDTLWNYEVGAKSDLFDGAATLDIAAYHIDWKDIQLIANRGGVNQIENAGEAKIDGVELSGRYRASAGLTVGGSLAYSDARMSEAAPLLGARDGERLPLSPRFSSSLTADYGFALPSGFEGSVGVSYRYVGDRTAGFDASTSKRQYHLDEFNLVDLRFSMRRSALDLGFFVKNVFDEFGEVSANTAGLGNATVPVRVAITQPRTVGIEATVHLSR